MQVKEQKPQADHPKVMVLGVYHMATPNQDEFNLDANDVLTTERQREIKAVVDSLSDFKPTKIAIEATHKYKSHYDSLYSAYQNGTHKLTRNEIQQLGFRLGHNFSHKRLYPVDYDGEWPFEAVKSFAVQKDTSFLAYWEQWGKSLLSKTDSLQNNASIREVLIYNNTEQYLSKQREAYARIAAVGNSNKYPGVHLVTEWYKRNLYIFANIENIVSAGDRIIVIFGSAHAPSLRNLIADSPNMTLVDPLNYL